MTKQLTLVAACAENRVMGRTGQLPWRIPEDFQFFQQTTAGQIVIMGRVCFESWTRAAHDGRRAVVITKDRTHARDGVFVAEDLSTALAMAAALPGDTYICGGQRIFEEAMRRPESTRLLLTLVHAEPEGDRYFPEWRQIYTNSLSQREGADANWRYTFYCLGRG